MEPATSPEAATAGGAPRPAAGVRVGSLYYHTLAGRPNSAVAAFLRGLQHLTGAGIIDIGPADGRPDQADAAFTRELWRRSLPECDIYLVHRPQHLGALRYSPAWSRVIYLAHTPYGACGMPQAVSERMLLPELGDGRAVAMSVAVADSYHRWRAAMRRLPPPLVPPRAWQRRQARVHHGLEPGAAVLGWVGRLAGEKQPALAVEVAAAAAAGLGRTVTLLMAGDGYLRERLERRAERARPAVDTRMLGFVPHEDIGSVYAAADALLVTSRFEATHFASVEAALAGCPVVGRPVGDVALIAAATASDVRGLAAAASQLLRGGAGLAGAACRSKASSLYDTEVAAAAWSGLLCEVTGAA